MPGTVLRSRTFGPLGMVALALLLLHPVSAPAQDDTEARAYLLSVKRLYEDLEYESALTQISRARAVTRTPANLTALALYEGIILAELSRWEASAAAFKKAVRLQPEAQLPVKVSPKVAQHFEVVRQSVKQELAASQKPPERPKPATPPPDRPVASKVLPEPKPQPPAAPPQASSSPEAVPSVTESRSFTRPQVLGPAIAGGVLVVLGGTSWALSRRELSRLNTDDPSLATPADVRQAASRGRTLQSVGVGLLGVGVAGLGFACGWYAFGPPSSETALSVGTDGTSAFVQGRWP
jgi:hypothetical protein